MGRENNLYKSFNKCANILLTVFLLVTVTGCCTCHKNVARITVPEAPPPVTKPIENVNVALVLGSGGFRGSAHIGVIEVLEEHEVPIDLIVGSSAGSFVGAFYADNPDAKQLKEKLMAANYNQLIDTSILSTIKAPFYPTGPVKGKALQKYMLANMQAKDFEELQIPLLITTTSIVNNKLEIMQTGPIIPAVHASMALPPYFAPVNFYENSYVDGGILAPIPVEAAKQYQPKVIIAVDICKKPSLVEPENAFQITSRAIDLSRYELAYEQAKAADIVISPEIRGYGTFDDKSVHEYYDAGRRAALNHIAEIKDLLLKFQTQAP